ncbi:metallophosphoesterase [Candidatus Woesearchaeota archaeon]|nr:metallophosphoesterase [Candidatus Woesearchaeota archaeon]
MGSRIVQLSDLHVQGEDDLKRLDSVRSYCSEEKPDAVILAGDFLDGFAVAKKVMKGLSREEQMYLQLPQILGQVEDEEQRKQFVAVYEELREKYGDPDEFEKALIQKAVAEMQPIAKATNSRLEQIAESGAKLLGVKGNHDPVESEKWYKPIHWLDREGITINGIRYEGSTNLNGEECAARVATLPDMPHLKAKKGKEDYDRIKKSWEGHKKKILIAHTPLKCKELDNEYVPCAEIEQLIKEDKPSAVLAGHTHKDRKAKIDGVQFFVSSHLVGYEHDIDDDGKIIASHRLLYCDAERYENDKPKFEKAFDVYRA